MLDTATTHDEGASGAPSLSAESVVNKALINAAAEAHASLEERLLAAQVSLRAAEAEQDAANRALADYVASVAAGNAEADTSQMEALDRAQKRVVFQVRLVAEIERQIADAKQAITAATAQAYAPMYQMGQATRLKAAQAADKARADLAAAEALFRQGTGFIVSALSRGAKHPGDHTSINLTNAPAHGVMVRLELPPGAAEAAERAFWAGLAI